MEKIIIFGDGSSSGNPGPGGYGTVILFTDFKNGKLNKEKTQVFELGEHFKATTNNRMELTAISEALALINNPPKGETGNKDTTKKEITIYTDSSYVLNGITKWIYSWIKNNWITSSKQEVLNQDLWKELNNNLKKTETTSVIKWKLVKGHSSILGNEVADVIAVKFSKKEKVKLFKGNLENYEKIIGKSFFKGDDIENAHNQENPEKTKSKKKPNKGLAYSYLSMVGGIIKKHQTWAECEKRVKCVKATRYKKALSKEDEEKIIKEWQS